MQPELILYSTWGCHLCDEAEQLLKQVTTVQKYRVVDIVDDEQAFARYRVSIPVLSFGEKELCWPFDAAQLTTWLKDIR
ncbi:MULTISPECIES: glutaredoxin family protein [Rheinheimera]|jgi:glutaredoxin|uniref:glutaredoxin family protein n=1 Tax=Rheinheimera TaxID=67575 RepID=UPI000E91C715|nr:glutaredoxin family protein [Rheinheimera aquimaris]MCD1599403.1 glutaredoxin family protein [Rheinheimera aquimaris]HBN88976.1 NrdH-redoxin [Rheinheimera sp.]|tara:strand:+ start:205 stop:441 length:237 start_codon:yes stop_codon:yes gene_type:complete